MSYGKEFYPAYCEGACFSMPSKIAHKLFEFIKVTRIDAPVDDAFITGIYCALPLVDLWLASVTLRPSFFLINKFLHHGSL